MKERRKRKIALVLICLFGAYRFLPNWVAGAKSAEGEASASTAKYAAGVKSAEGEASDLASANATGDAASARSAEGGVVCKVSSRDDACSLLDPAEQWPSNALLCPKDLVRLDFKRDLSVAVSYRLNVPDPACCDDMLLRKAGDGRAEERTPSDGEVSSLQTNSSCCDKLDKELAGSVTLQTCPWIAWDTNQQPVYPRGPQHGGDIFTRCGIRQLLNATSRGVLSYDFVSGSVLGSVVGGDWSHDNDIDSVIHFTSYDTFRKGFGSFIDQETVFEHAFISGKGSRHSI